MELAVRLIEPNVAVPSNMPVTIEDPSGRTDTAFPLSLPPELPALTAHANVPSALSLATNASVPPWAVRLVEPNVAVPPNPPVMIDDPSGSAPTPLPPLEFDAWPTTRVAHANVPSAFALAIHTSVVFAAPAFVRVVEPNVAVPLKEPVATDAPSLNIETAAGCVLCDPPPPWVAHVNEPAEPKATDGTATNSAAPAMSATRACRRPRNDGRVV